METIPLPAEVVTMLYFVGGGLLTAVGLITTLSFFPAPKPPPNSTSAPNSPDSIDNTPSSPQPLKKRRSKSTTKDQETDHSEENRPVSAEDRLKLSEEEEQRLRSTVKKLMPLASEETIEKWIEDGKRKSYEAYEKYGEEVMQPGGVQQLEREQDDSFSCSVDFFVYLILIAAIIIALSYQNNISFLEILRPIFPLEVAALMGETAKQIPK